MFASTQEMSRVGLFHLRFQSASHEIGKDDQQTKTTMIPATLMHLVTIAANLTERMRLEEQPRVMQGKEGEHAHYIWKEGLQL